MDTNGIEVGDIVRLKSRPTDENYGGKVTHFADHEFYDGVVCAHVKRDDGETGWSAVASYVVVEKASPFKDGDLVTWGGKGAAYRWDCVGENPKYYYAGKFDLVATEGSHTVTKAQRRVPMSDVSDFLINITVAGEPDEAEDGDDFIKDAVLEPAHYTQYEIEPAEFIMRNKLDYETGQVIKYAMRAGNKQYGGKTIEECAIADLEKARRYAEMKINLILGKEVL